MVFKAISGSGGDLSNDPASFYGALDDVILVLSGSNSILTMEGNDIVYTTRAAALTTQTALLGFGDDMLVGGAGADFVFDGSGNDRVSLGAGNDTAHASAGNDVLDGGTGSDTIDFLLESYDGFGDAGNNKVGITCDLALTTAQNFSVFGIDTISSFENANGSFGSDRLLGTAGANVLAGFDGNDILDGRAGNDTLRGNVGADIFIGGAGNDTMFAADDLAVGGPGPAARDTFRYNLITDSGITAATWDTIFGFDKVGATHDVIDLSLIDANPLLAGNQAFKFLGAGAFTALAGEVRLTVVGTDTYVHVDTNATAADEMTIKLAGVTGLTAADFIL